MAYSNTIVTTIATPSTAAATAFTPGDVTGPGAHVRIEDLWYRYPGRDVSAWTLQGIDLALGAGELVGLLGPSGCGKTTLLTLVGALRQVQEGSVRLFAHELQGADRGARQQLRRRIGMIFQGHNLLRCLSAEQNVQMGADLLPDLGYRARRDQAREWLRAVGLGDHLAKLPHDLSGGQKQRVAIARALAARPELLLADEPTAALDRRSGREVVDLLKRLAREQGCAVLMVTHDPRILDVADRLLRMEDGRLFPQTLEAA